MEAHLFLRDALERVVEGLDALAGEGEVVLDRGLGVDLVPVLGDRGVVDLHDEPGVGDGPVLLAQGLGARGEHLVLVGVVLVLQAGAGARGQRGEVALARPRGLQRGPEVADVRGHGLLADVLELSRDLRERLLLARGDPRGGVRVRVGEQLPVAAVAEAREHHVAGGGALRLLLPQVDVAGSEPGDPCEDVVPPCPVVHGGGHGVAVLAVVDDVDARLALPAHDVGHGFLEQLLVPPGGRAAGAAGLVGREQLGGAGEGPGVGREDAVGTVQHGGVRPFHRSWR